jgi:hypothetical protein
VHGIWNVVKEGSYRPDAPEMMGHIVALREVAGTPACSATEFRGIMARRSSQNYSSTHWVNIEQEASEGTPVTQRAR